MFNTKSLILIVWVYGKACVVASSRYNIAPCHSRVQTRFLPIRCCATLVVKHCALFINYFISKCKSQFHVIE